MYLGKLDYAGFAAGAPDTPAYAKHETMIHLSFEGVFPLLDTLYRKKVLDELDVIIRSPFTCCTVEQNGVAKIPAQLCVVFKGFCSHHTKAKVSKLQKLWSCLHEYGLQVTWKHETHGYKIGPDFAILKTWELDDGGC